MVFNLLAACLPLDGGRVLCVSLLPDRPGLALFPQLERFGFPDPARTAAPQPVTDSTCSVRMLTPVVIGVLAGDAADRQFAPGPLSRGPQELGGCSTNTIAAFLRGRLARPDHPLRHPEVIEQSVWDMVIDWLAAGIDPAQAVLFIQSRVPEHAELHLLLSMMTPLGWLERVPTYKDQQEKLKEKDLSTYGFLGYPLLQSGRHPDLPRRAVPVGEDQVPHIELTREVARRFNHLYGREPGFEDKARELQ
jgi:hypothetical protein